MQWREKEKDSTWITNETVERSCGNSRGGEKSVDGFRGKTAGMVVQASFELWGGAT